MELVRKNPKKAGGGRNVEMWAELRRYFQEKLSGTVGYAAVARDMGYFYPGEDGKESLEKYYRL